MCPPTRAASTKWGRHVGASSRTLARLFVAETGLTFTGWRTQVRVRAAMGLLAENVPVGVVAQLVGRRNSSAFSAMFTAVTGERASTFGASLSLQPIESQ